MTGAPASAREAQPGSPPGRSVGYQRLLLALLIPAALFESYDSQLRGLLLRQIQANFHVGVAALGLVNIPISSGQFGAFFLVRSADRYGRRPILVWSILGYTLFTTLTAASWDLASFAVFQFGAQVCIGAEFGVAVTLLAEETPPALRGRRLALLLLFSPVGAAVAGGLVAAGLLHQALGWRVFFLLAALPLLLVSLARRRLQESAVFLRTRPGGPGRRPVQRGSLWRGSFRRRLAAVSAIAFLQSLAATSVIGWWTFYAEQQRGLAPALAGLFFAIAALSALAGYVLCGYLIDRVGRRPTTVAYVVGAVGWTIAAFHVTTPAWMLICLIGSASFGLGLAPALSAFAAELFPTALRAGASAWIRNGFATAGALAGPALVGVLGARGGPLGNVGTAVTVISTTALPIIVIVWRAIPETRQAVLGEESGAPGGGVPG